MNSGIDDMINGTHQKEFQEMKNQVAQLEERWDQFRRKLSSSIEGNKRAIKRQVEFDQEHQKICAVLQTVLRGTENTSLDQTDMALNHDRVEDFQTNFEKYRLDFDSLLRQSEDLDQDVLTGSNYKTRLDDNMSHVRQLWSSVLKRADEHKEQVGRQNERLKEFQCVSSALIKWMDGIETHSGFTVPSSASIQQMKVHFEHVKMCQKEINAHRPEYNNFCSTGQLIIEETPGSLGNKAARELDKVTRQWTMITNRVTSNQQQLELSLKDWQEYTSLTENLMVWLREKEKVLRAQSKALTVRDVERELGAMKAIAGEIDERKPQLDKISWRAEELSKSTDQYDSERIKKQVASMTTLWGSVCHLLSSSMQSLAEILRHFQQFSQLHEALSDWLVNIESSVTRELEESFLSIPDDQGDTVFQVYVADIEGHENTRSTLNESAYYVISKAGGTPYAGAVAEKQKNLNDRWRALCQQLGITYKKAEETRYGLKLLEIQLKQLNTWMAEVETKLREFSVVSSCVVSELQRKVKEMKDTETDVERRATDVQTVLRLCEKLRRDRMACPSEEDRQSLQRTKESFENRWINARHTVSAKRRQAEERMVLCREFWNEYEKFVEWIDLTEASVTKSEEAMSSGLEVSKSKFKRFEVFLKDVNSHRPQMERIIKRSKYLLLEANTTSASDVRVGVESIQSRWGAIFSRVENRLHLYSKLSDKVEKFETLRQEVYSFLTEAELKLITLDPYTSEAEPRVQLEKLKGLQRLINMNYAKLRTLLHQGKAMREYCSSSEFQPVQQAMDELNSRWQQALHCCMTWILDLAIPSPRSSAATAAETN